MKTWKKPLLFGSSVTLLLSLSFFYVSGCRPKVILSPPDLPGPSDIRPKGKVDYGWALRRLDGTEVTFSQFKNKVVFLNFWATWCPPCTVELPNIQRLHESLKTKDIVFVVSSYENENVVKGFISSKRLKLPIYLHGDSVPSVFILNRGIPVTFLINRKGAIVYEHTGPAKWDDESVRDFLLGLGQK